MRLDLNSNVTGNQGERPAKMTMTSFKKNIFKNRHLVLYGVTLTTFLALKELQSQLDWVIVRPGNLTDGGFTGKYMQGFAATDKNIKVKISRADVADFMLKQLTDDTYLHKMPGLSY